MSVAPLLWGLTGALFGLGVFVAVAGWCGQLDRRRRPRRLAHRVDRLAARATGAALGLGVAAWWTRWPVAMAAGAVIGWSLPTLVGLKASRQRLLARSEAIAIWAEMLRDLLVSNAGLAEAIGKSARVAPPAIRDEVRALYVRSQRGDLAGALGRFADALDDPIADTVVAALQIADQRAAADLGSMLAAVAASTRDTVAMQLRVNATRVRTYRTAQLISLIVAFFVGALVAMNRDYLAPFGTFVGQLVLAAVVALVAGAVWAMVSLSRPVRAERVLSVGSSPQGAR